MPFLIGCLALGFPRLAMVLVWLFGHGYFERAFGTWAWPLLGFFFLPVSTITFAYAANDLGRGGEVTSLGWLLTLVALLIDLGLLGGGRRQWRSRKE